MHTIVALIVFAIGLSATLYYWRNLRQSVDTDMHAAYVHQVQSITSGMNARMQLYQNFLRGSAGLFAIHNNLTQDEWEKYHAPYDISHNYPDIEGIGVGRYLSAADVPAYLQRRADQGSPNFTIVPQGDRPVYVPVTFSAQYGGNNDPLGYDGYTDSIRHAAMDQAVNTGQLTMSGQIMAANARPARPSFMLYLPVYKNDQPSTTAAERWSSLLGFAYVEVDTAAFENTVLNDNQSSYISLRIEDPSTGGHVVYESSNFAHIQAMRGARVQTSNATFYGHGLRMTFAGSPELIALRERQLPEQALWRGLVTCVFFAGLVWYLITDRERKYARQKREEVQTAKDDLLSLASHQLRTPATVVKQYVGMLLQGYAGKLSGQQIDMLNNAYESNERQLDIINELLYVARLDAGRITLHVRKLDVAELLEDVAHDYLPAVQERRQTLTTKGTSRQLQIEADPHYLRMTLDNLVSNAVKYTPEDGSITVEIHRALNEVLIRVRDNGVGIDPVLQENIFEKFTRVENELSTDVNGSGVGLYLTRQIVELHGGSITVKSSSGKGSTFTIRLPVHQVKTDPSLLEPHQS